MQLRRFLISFAALALVLDVKVRFGRHVELALHDAIGEDHAQDVHLARGA